MTLDTQRHPIEMSCARLSILALFITHSSLDSIQGTPGTENRNEGEQGPKTDKAVGFQKRLSVKQPGCGSQKMKRDNKKSTRMLLVITLLIVYFLTIVK